MNASQVTSADGTAIAYERYGYGPPLIVVGGATCDRAKTRPTAQALGRRLATLNYDRRGRGASGDTAPYAVERELEDLAALIAAAGGSAALYGHSSGAGLVLHAVAAGLPVTRFVLHDPPYVPDDEAMKREARAYATELDSLLAADRHGDAVALFFRTTGMPDEMVDVVRQEPGWASLERLAPTLAYDSAVMGDASHGGVVPADVVARADKPGLVLCGGENPAFMREVGEQVSSLLPNGELRVLDGQGHVVPPELLAPIVAEYVVGEQ
ncbi:MAG TPA: alpha/beta hydrolase [Thermoleophilaceae bacterium]|nr:alpha/beta hydrolase [Thermoleophilaceae bacterium]